MDNFETIMTFTNPTELAILRTRLESDGIECRVLDELTAQVNSFYTNAIGGIKLQVKESDIQKATEILKDGGYIKNDNLRQAENLTKLDNTTSRPRLLKNLQVGLQDQETNISCPYCGSEEISKPKLSGRAFAISILLLGFPLPFISKTYHCFDCGQDFKKNKD